MDGRTGQRTKKRTTRGWELEVEWRDGSTTWIPLKELKETNPVEVSQYASDNRIIDQPAFDWWCPDLLKKRSRLIKATKAAKKRHLRTNFKFGIELPRSVEHALELDAASGTTFWHDAIVKEMTNVRVAFRVLDAGDKAPPGYKHIPLRMIFDVKMDFTRKARLVAGGHLTDPPTEMTYSSVVSRESVRIAFLIAALNDLELIMSDVGNAYLNAPTKEKVCSTAGKGMGA